MKSKETRLLESDAYEVNISKSLISNLDYTLKVELGSRQPNLIAIPIPRENPTVTSGDTFERVKALKIKLRDEQR